MKASKKFNIAGTVIYAIQTVLCLCFADPILAVFVSASSFILMLCIVMEEKIKADGE